ncbi:Histidine kinase-, DNA gyrase B-, and HSP90-like ATPase [Porphyromonadaceae bacterium NLAE-zl-C104]|nr:Histidine kinase-, DNA gyrase B-, and HSP90-like ATPase [Porphyromonadaceae bacterium KH3R12]SFS91887.1 Histidine kinase-, DNA gyrase B-, and HSP90-like ATPase [Porphyromonadaceae bacterium NLAE-zl-C104]
MYSRQSLTYLFVIMAIIVVLVSLWLSNRLVKELAYEERRKIEIWAMATESMLMDEEMDMSLVLRILESNTTIPIILYDKSSGKLTPRNIKLPEEDAESYLQIKIVEFGRRHDPIALLEMNQLLYYDDSHTLKTLQLYPYWQLLVIALFTGLAFFALNRSQRAERDRVWVGLSKETAHQLGTPISSLTAWMEYMKLKEIDPQLLTEIDKDVSRLQMITERFSKIGSITGLKPEDLRGVIRRSVAYLEKRVSGAIVFNMRFPEHPVIVDLNEPLFGWVIENIVKNGVDAMQGEGIITFEISEKGKMIHLDISDTGKGLHKSKFKKIFSPGYTTKDRGWGLGLTLVERIVEENHKGEIFVRRSEPGKGTTFRIQLRKN